MPLQATLRLNFAWSLLLTAAFGLLFTLAPTLPRAIVLLAAVGYLVASRIALRRNRFAVAVAIVTAAWFAIRWVPMVGMNAWMFATDHMLYRDSPATILVVAIYAGLFALPGFSLTLLYLLQLRKVRAVLAST